MEHFLAQCGMLEAAGYPLLSGIVLGGLVGSLTHCSVMCSPLVAAQMLAMPQPAKLRRDMAFYHMGRIGTYMLLGMAAVLLQRFLFSGGLASLSHVMLLVAGVLFVASAAFPARTHHCCGTRTRKLQRWIARLSHAPLQYFLRGGLMGFMPCGMLLSALLLVGTLPSAAHAALAMMLFGLATVPALQLAGMAALTLGRRYPSFGRGLGRAALAANGMFLCGIGLGLVPVR